MRLALGAVIANFRRSCFGACRPAASSTWSRHRRAVDARDASVFRASCPLIQDGHSTLCSADYVLVPSRGGRVVFVVDAPCDRLVLAAIGIRSSATRQSRGRRSRTAAPPAPVRLQFSTTTFDSICRRDRLVPLFAGRLDAADGHQFGAVTTSRSSASGIECGSRKAAYCRFSRTIATVRRPASVPRRGAEALSGPVPRSRAQLASLRRTHTDRKRP